MLFLFLVISNAKNHDSISLSNIGNEDDFITITNNFTLPDYNLYSVERSGEYDEVQYQRTIRANYNFDVTLYMISEFCTDYTYICTINSTSDSSFEKIINDSDAPDNCRSPYLYFVTIKNNLSEIEECDLYYLSSFGRYIKITDQYSKREIEAFSLDIYIKSKKCDEYTYALTVNSSLNKEYEKVISDSDVPSECITGYKYFLTVINNFTEFDFSLYYLKSDGMYKEIEESYFEKSSSEFSIDLYMISDYCIEITYVCTINSSLDQSYEFVVDDSNAPKSCQSPYIYFVTIVNNFTKSDFHLYYLTSKGKYEEIGKRYSERGNATFTVDLYITSYKCQQYTHICTVQASEDKDYENYINDSNAPNECIPTYYITIENKFSRSDYHLYYLSVDDEYKEIIDSFSMTNTDQFSIELYMSSPYCTNYNFIITINSTLDEQFKNSINDSYVPYICKYESNYFLTIVNGFTISEYNLYYYSESSSSYEIVENSRFLSYPSEFSVRIYMTSESCTNYRLISIASSSTDKSYEKVIQNSDAPEVCQPNKYFITIVNSFTETDFRLFYSLNKRTYTEITNSTLIQDKSEFTVYLYMRSDLCRSYTLINTTYSSLDKDYKQEINDDYAPSSCKSPYQNFITIKNNFTLSDCHLYYSDDEENGYKEITDSIFLQDTVPFNISLYMKSDFCKEYTFLYTVDSQSTHLFEKVIGNDDAPQECVVYEVCFDLNSLSMNYTIGYSLSYDNESTISNTSHGSNVIKCYKQFNATIYLVSSPYCDDNTEIDVIQSDLDFECIEFNESIIPDECKDGDDSGSDSKKVNVPLIAGLSSAAFVLLAVGVVITIIIIRKRKNAQFLDNSNNIRENLNDDNDYTNINTN